VFQYADRCFFGYLLGGGGGVRGFKNRYLPYIKKTWVLVKLRRFGPWPSRVKKSVGLSPWSFLEDGTKLGLLEILERQLLGRIKMTGQ